MLSQCFDAALNALMLSQCQQKRKASDIDAGYGAAAAEEAILSPPTVVDLCSSDDETDPLCAISAVGQAVSAPVWEVASAYLLLLACLPA